jgi:hypothetical protein
VRGLLQQGGWTYQAISHLGPLIREIGWSVTTDR